MIYTLFGFVSLSSAFGRAKTKPKMSHLFFISLVVGSKVSLFWKRPGTVVGLQIYGHQFLLETCICNLQVVQLSAFVEAELAKETTVHLNQLMPGTIVQVDPEKAVFDGIYVRILNGF